MFFILPRAWEKEKNQNFKIKVPISVVNLPTTKSVAQW